MKPPKKVPAEMRHPKATRFLIHPTAMRNGVHSVAAASRMNHVLQCLNSEPPGENIGTMRCVDESLHTGPALDTVQIWVKCCSGRCGCAQIFLHLFTLNSPACMTEDFQKNCACSLTNSVTDDEGELSSGEDEGQFWGGGVQQHLQIRECGTDHRSAYTLRRGVGFNCHVLG